MQSTTEENFLWLEKHFLSEVRKRKAVIPNLDGYLEMGKLNPATIAFRAARNGDIIILEILLNSNISKLGQNYTELQALSQKEEDRKVRLDLLRDYHLLCLQKTIVENFYKRHSLKGMAHLDDLEATLKGKLFGVWYAFGKEYLVMLKKLSEINHNGKVLQLTRERRAKLYLEYLKKTEDKRIPSFEVDGKNLEQLEQEYFSLLEKINRWKQSISFLKREEKLLKQNAIEARNQIFKAVIERNIYNHELLLALHRSGDLKHSLHSSKIKKIMDQSEVPIETTDPSNGNSLLHEALSNGEYLAADYLIAKGHPLFSRNFSGLRAIDTQDQKGNFYLRYLATKKKYDLICDYILMGAGIDLINHDNESILDVVRDNDSLLQFLIRKLSNPDCSEKYRMVFSRILAISFGLQHLSLQDRQDVTVFELLHNLPDKEKKQICSTLTTFKISEIFNSKFEADVNYVLWLHFFKLITTKPSNSLRAISDAFKSLTGTSKKTELLLQLKLIGGLYTHLKRAKQEGCDKKLFLFLKSILSEISAPVEIEILYKLYLKTYDEDLHHRRPGRKNYAIFLPQEKMECYIYTPTYKFIARSLPQGNAEPIEKQENISYPPVLVQQKEKQPLRTSDSSTQTTISASVSIRP